MYRLSFVWISLLLVTVTLCTSCFSYDPVGSELEIDGNSEIVWSRSIPSNLVVISPNGELVATISEEAEGYLTVLETKSGVVRSYVTFQGRCYGIAFGNDGRSIAIIGSTSLQDRYLEVVRLEDNARNRLYQTSRRDAFDYPQDFKDQLESILEKENIMTYDGYGSTFEFLRKNDNGMETVKIEFSELTYQVKSVRSDFQMIDYEDSEYQQVIDSRFLYLAPNSILDLDEDKIISKLIFYTDYGYTNELDVRSSHIYNDRMSYDRGELTIETERVGKQSVFLGPLTTDAVYFEEDVPNVTALPSFNGKKFALHLRDDSYRTELENAFVVYNVETKKFVSVEVEEYFHIGNAMWLPHASDYLLIVSQGSIRGVRVP